MESRNPRGWSSRATLRKYGVGPEGESWGLLCSNYLVVVLCFPPARTCRQPTAPTSTTQSCMQTAQTTHTIIEYTILCVWNSNFLQGGIFGIWKVVIWDSRSSAELLLVGCACARALACSCGARQSDANDLAGGRQAASVTALVRCSAQSARYVSSSCGGDHRAESAACESPCRGSWARVIALL